MSGEFNRIFLKKEFKAILGKNLKGVRILSLILLITFLALGHVFEGREELKRRMLNPYTNWVSLRNLGGNDKLEKKFYGDFNDDDLLKTQYEVHSVTRFDRGNIHFIDKNLQAKTLGYRTLEFDMLDPLYGTILDPSNVIRKNEELLESNNNCAIIITRESLEALSYDMEVGNMSLPLQYTDLTNEKADYMVELEVLAIVEELPNEIDVVISNNLQILIDGDPGFIKINEDVISVTNEIKLDPKDSTEIIDRTEYTISFFDKELNYYSNVLNNNQGKRLARENSSIADQWVVYDADCFISKYGKNTNPEYYSINLNTTENVRELSDKVKSDYSIEIPLADVEAKDNFWLMSRLAYLFIILLIFFSLATIVLFLSNIVTNHLNKIKANLGTLKAFGLSNTEISNLYTSLFTRYFIISSLISLVLLIIYHFLINALSASFSFQLFDWKLLVIWVSILIFLVFFFRITVRRILFKTPGDLIYNR
jgi:hypothetical protein